MPEYYTDPTPIDIENWVDMNKVDELHKKLANWIRVKMNGIDVREALARLVEQTSSDLFDANEVALALENLAISLEEKWNEEYQLLSDEWKNTLAGVTVDSEVINARIDIRGFVYKTLKERLDAMEDSHFTIESGEADVLVTLQDDRFSQNHVLVKVKRVDDPIGLSGLIIAEVDNSTQDTFYLEKVGEI